MEICPHCGMYMQPFMPTGKIEVGKQATCEFCGEPIAEIERRADGKFYWKKLAKRLAASE